MAVELLQQDLWPYPKLKVFIPWPAWVHSCPRTCCRDHPAPSSRNSWSQLSCSGQTPYLRTKSHVRFPDGWASLSQQLLHRAWYPEVQWRTAWTHSGISLWHKNQQCQLTPPAAVRGDLTFNTTLNNSKKIWSFHGQFSQDKSKNLPLKSILDNLYKPHLLLTRHSGCLNL